MPSGFRMHYRRDAIRILVFIVGVSLFVSLLQSVSVLKRTGVNVVVSADHESVAELTHNKNTNRESSVFTQHASNQKTLVLTQFLEQRTSLRKAESTKYIQPTLSLDAKHNNLCSNCFGNSSGPCMHETLPVCFPYKVGTQECEPLTYPCQHGENQRKPGQNLTDVNPQGSTNFVIVTGASANHFCSLIGLLGSLANTVPNAKLILYDLASEPPFLEEDILRYVYSNIIEFRKFPYKKYPEYFKIETSAGQYAWKPIIIKAVVDQFGEAIWVDSGNYAVENVFSIERLQNEFLQPSGFYSPTSQNSPMHWVHAGMFQFYGMRKCCASKKYGRGPCCCCGEQTSNCVECPGSELEDIDPNEWRKKSMCNAAVVAFRKPSTGYEKILIPWVECALNPDCISPTGPGDTSSRKNHRQDQSSLTILSHLHGMSCKGDESTVGFILHQDNRKTNWTYCEQIKKSFAARPRMQTHNSDEKDFTNSKQWAPWKQRRDILTSECLADSRPKQWTSSFLPEEDPEFHFTHAINPFLTTDVHFNWTIPSIQAALKFAKEQGIRVQILAITFNNEHPSLPRGWKHLPILDPKRSAGTYLQSRGIDFGNKEIPLKGPIVSDVFQAIYNFSQAKRIIWTNFDLIVRLDFYVQLYEIMRNPQQKLGLMYKSLIGMSVLRADVLLSRERYPTLDHLSSDDFFAHNNTQKQAGHDCFVFPRHWLQCLDIRHMVFGVGGWDHAIYSEFKLLAHYDQAQFRTLDTSRIPPMAGVTEAPPPPPRKPGGGLDKFIKNSVRPGYGLTRHLGSQVANVAKFWTNPVSWKGSAREIQYGANKRLKYEIEVFITASRSPSHFCHRKYMQVCTDSNNFEVVHGLASDGRLIGLAAATPVHDAVIKEVLHAALALQTGDSHEEGMDTESRDRMAGLLTHAKDLLAGPKSTEIFNSRELVSGRKQRTFRAVLLFIEEPRASLESWMLLDGITKPTTSDINNYVNHFIQFWEFWIHQFKTAVTYMEIMNFDLVDEDELSKELLLLQEFMQLHRCGRGGSREWMACNGGGKEKPISGKLCCSLEILANEKRNTFLEGYPSKTIFSTEQRDNIQSRTLAVYQEVVQLWRNTRQRYSWPSGKKCCNG